MLVFENCLVSLIKVQHHVLCAAEITSCQDTPLKFHSKNSCQELDAFAAEIASFQNIMQVLFQQNVQRFKYRHSNYYI